MGVLTPFEDSISQQVFKLTLSKIPFCITVLGAKNFKILGSGKHFLLQNFQEKGRANNASFYCEWFMDCTTK